MQRLLILALSVSIVMLLAASMATASDTLVVYATQGYLNTIINTDLASALPHSVYKLVTTDTTYLFNGPITTTLSITVVGVPDPVTQRPPCIQPGELADYSNPQILFLLNANNISGTFKNLYLQGLAVNNEPAGTGTTGGSASGTAIQVSADYVSVVADNCIFEQWLGFAVGTSGNWTKLRVTNSKFRNMAHPNQYYVGEAFRNEWSANGTPMDSIIMDYNTFLCVNGYACAPVTKQITKYVEFCHNDVIYTAKNPLFIFGATVAKVNDNIFYGTYAVGVSYAEAAWWDNLTVPDTTYGVVAFQPLTFVAAQQFDPADSANHAIVDSIAEYNRVVQVKNNVCFWPSTMTTFWTNWNDTATWSSTGDKFLTPTWENARTIAMFSSDPNHPHFTQSGNVQTDPGFGATLGNVLTGSVSGYGLGLLPWVAQIRTSQAPTVAWGYQLSKVDSTNPNWIPTWPLPEQTAGVLQYSGTFTSSDGRHTGDPYWFTGGPTSVEPRPDVLPKKFSLSEAYPNPFNPTTNIQYTLNKSGVVSLKIYDVLGRLVNTVVDNANQAPSTYTVNVDMSRFTSGVYIYVLQQGNNRLAQKMMLLK